MGMKLTQMIAEEKHLIFLKYLNNQNQSVAQISLLHLENNPKHATTMKT